MLLNEILIQWNFPERIKFGWNVVCLAIKVLLLSPILLLLLIE